MKVVLVNGSPNKEGSTYVALKEIADTLYQAGVESEIFWLGKKAIGGCIACGQCGTLKKCVFDDVVNEFREIAMGADGFVFGTPVHFASASGNITSFMDRLFYSEAVGNRCAALKLKPAASVAIARRGGASAALDQLNKYINYAEMPMVSSSYWNMVHGANAKDVPEDKEGLYTMRVLARNMVYLLKCLEAGKNAEISPPEYEKKQWTNFIR
ncbi:MAG: flavodoxin family protein [Lachnospiraceae bacterium]|nr:flavodoxin family protein [Lachnospiraceae bacterium]